ncbi:NACHT, LRR and PYD domains-containing protein 6-like [Mobula birostris]|uniref:NACHT, LRR and PYD domains-containing protein 6-like n=1 Tax=Mobula birostris TaxID=1983395 RepID=UPI003B28062A
MRKFKPRFMLNFVLLMLLVGPVPCLPVKPEPDDDKHEVNVTDSRDRAEVHSRELNRTFRTSVGPDSRNEADNQLQETLKTAEANVDEGHESASHIVGKTIDGSVPSRMIENRTLTAPKKELDTSERSEWSGWAMADAPAFPDVQDREEKYNRNRRRKSTSDNFGPGYGWKSDIVHSTSFGTGVSGDNIVDKGRTLMLLDRETDASGARKTAVEVQLCQYIGLPIGFAIVLAACAWFTRWWDRCWNGRHGYEPVDGENEQYNVDEEQRSIPDVKRRHRSNLQNQSGKLNLPKPCLISDIYTELTITVIQGEPPNLIGETNTHICEVQHHELFKQNNRDSDMSTISVVYGAAGTGKSTLIQKLIYDWATGMIYEEFSFVLHLKIQKLNEIKGCITLSRLIVDTYPYLENYLDRLWNEPKRLLFIFDDLDQLYRLFTLSDTGRNSDSRYRCVDTESEYFVCDILRCLLQGEFLRGCSVLITTRVWKLELLHHVTADSTFQVMGFTLEKAKEYFRRYLRNGQNANEVVEFIEQNELLWDMCTDPLFCVTLVSTLESFQAQGEEQETNLIISHTKVLSDYVAHLVAKCGYDGNTHRNCLTTIGELAEKGIKENTLSFEGYALGDPDSSTSMLISAFMHQDPDKKSGGVIYNFRHSVLRDFLAALTNVLNASISRLKQILDEISNDIAGRFSTFSIFLVGLSSRRSTDRLEMELHAFPTEVTSCISEWLRKNVSRRLTDMDSKHTQRMFLCILYCLFEFGDNEIMTEVLNPITTIKLNHLRLRRPDCIVLSRILIAPEVIQELDLSSCFAQPEEIWKLEQVLPRCVILRLNQNNLQDSGVKRLFDVLSQSNIRTLTLKSNHLTDNCLESVFVALTTNPSLMQLNLSNSSQDGEQVNQFTDEKLQYYYERSTQQREIKWRRIKNIGQDIVQSVTESNRLTLITE